MLVALWWAIACTGDARPDGDPEAAARNPDQDPDGTEDLDTGAGYEEDPDFDEIADERLYQALFDYTSVKEVHITLGPDARMALDLDPRTYVPATVVVEGTRLENVGVRLKGSSTFRPLSDKSSFKIHFNEFEEDTRYATLKRLTLNNMVDDPAQSREVLAYHLFNEAGLSAPRAAFARVWVDDAEYGLYTLLEPMDSEFLERRYTEDEGNLYEANDSANLTAEGIAHFELSTGPGGTELADAVAVLDGATDFYAEADAVVDLEQFMDYYAWMNMVGNPDGYPFHLNDFFLYADPGDDLRLDISPWGLDESWSTAWTLEWGWSSTIPHRCLADPGCRDMAEARFDAALAAYEASGIDLLAAQLYDLTADAVLTDPRRPYTPAEVDLARAELSAMLVGWGDAVRRGWWLEPAPEVP